MESPKPELESINPEKQELLDLFEEFKRILELAKKEGGEYINKALELKGILEKKKKEHKEKQDPFGEIKLKDQYNKQVEMLDRLGIIPGREIVGIDGKQYSVPTFNEIKDRIMENKEVLKKKVEQGFTELLLVPFGMSLDKLSEKYKEVILKHHKEGKLLATKKDPSDPGVKLELDEAEPLHVWEKYENADKNGELVRGRDV